MDHTRVSDRPVPEQPSVSQRGSESTSEQLPPPHTADISHGRPVPNSPVNPHLPQPQGSLESFESLKTLGSLSLRSIRSSVDSDHADPVVASKSPVPSQSPPALAHLPSEPELEQQPHKPHIQDELMSQVGSEASHPLEGSESSSMYVEGSEELMAVSGSENLSEGSESKSEKSVDDKVLTPRFWTTFPELQAHQSAHHPADRAHKDSPPVASAVSAECRPQPQPEEEAGSELDRRPVEPVRSHSAAHNETEDDDGDQEANLSQASLEYGTDEDHLSQSLTPVQDPENPDKTLHVGDGGFIHSPSTPVAADTTQKHLPHDQPVGDRSNRVFTGPSHSKANTSPVSALRLGVKTKKVRVKVKQNKKKVLSQKKLDQIGLPGGDPYDEDPAGCFDMSSDQSEADTKEARAEQVVKVS